MTAPHRRDPLPGPSSTASRPSNLLRSALNQARTQPNLPKNKPPPLPTAPPPDITPSTPTSKPQAVSTPLANSRIQFEEQQDFIGFDFDEEEDSPPKEKNKRGTPGGNGGGRNGKRRRFEEGDERKELGTERMRDRERGRSTPWCDDGELDWESCTNSIQM